MKKICSYPGCNNIVEVDDFDRSSPRCPLHPQTHTPKRRYSHHHNSSGKNIYYSNRWKKLRQAYAEHQPLCEECLKLDIVTEMAVVDHIKEIYDGGEPFDWNNLQSLCHSCHNRKSARERRKRKAGGLNLNDF